MGNFFKSLLFGEAEESAEDKAKRDFEMFKYDGIRALQMGKQHMPFVVFRKR